MLARPAQFTERSADRCRNFLQKILVKPVFTGYFGVEGRSEQVALLHRNAAAIFE